MLPFRPKVLAEIYPCLVRKMEVRHWLDRLKNSPPHPNANPLKHD